MVKEEIGIVLVATNSYFILGIRFIKQFEHFYEGDRTIKYYFFSDIDPKEYLPDNINLEYHSTQHNSWVDATNSKFKNILLLENSASNYLYYFDADTAIGKPFTEMWFLGTLVGGEHFDNRGRLANGQGFDRNKIGNSYVPLDSKLPYTYHYGAFFGGRKEHVISMCEQLREWQVKDQSIRYEPPVNDESYINKFFHYTPNYTVPIENFQFIVSDKGGLGTTRDISLSIEEHKKNILQNKNKMFNLRNNIISYE